MERQAREVTGWGNPVEEKVGFVEAACRKHEVLIAEKLENRGRRADMISKIG